MKQILLTAAAAALLGTSVPMPVEAGVIERACRQSSRLQGDPQLCNCIQKVANHSLTRSERRKVAKWFDDPHKAQETRQSAKPGDEVLWKRYKAFGAEAQATCG